MASKSPGRALALSFPEHGTAPDPPALETASWKLGALTPASLGD